MHAVTHVADMYEDRSFDHNDKSQLFQNYNIFIGNESDYTKNQKCAGGPFLQIDEPNNYVFDAFAYTKDGGYNKYD